MAARRHLEVYPVWTKIQDPNNQKGAHLKDGKRLKTKALLALGRQQQMKTPSPDIKIQS